MTDENKLTNLVFFTRHPELGGRRIRADEHDLASEWRQIRRDVVRPVLERVGQELYAEADEDEDEPMSPGATGIA